MDLDALITDEFLPYEEALVNDPENESIWLDYAQAAEGSLERSAFILERAVCTLSASHNLWNAYLLLPWTDSDLDTLISLYRRVLTILPETPALWLRFIELTKKKGELEQLTEALDLALFNLHHSHHKRLWEEYIALAGTEKGELGSCVYKRIFDMQDSENCTYIYDRCGCVLKIAQLGDVEMALKLLQRIPKTLIKNSENDSAFLSIILDILISKNLYKDCVQFERIALDAALDMPFNESKYLSKIATFYLKRSQTNKARHFFNLSLNLATTLKGLANVFEKFTDFLSEDVYKLNEAGNYDCAELSYESLESLLASQPFLVNDILIKKEPNNIDLWLERVKIHKDRQMTNDVIATIISAIKSVNPLETFSRNNNTLVSIWLEYANLYISLGDEATASLIFSRAVKSQYRNPDELAEIYIQWCELALMNSDEEAVRIIEEVLLVIPTNADEVQFDDKMFTVQERVFKSTKLWSFYIDLLSSMGESEVYKTKLQMAYEQMMKLKTITLRLLFQYADFLLEKKEARKCFSVYEAGILTFETPTPRFKIWKAYLSKLMELEDNSEIVAEAFERCIDSKLPGQFASEIFKTYAAYLESRGALTKSIKLLQSGIKYLSEALESNRGHTEMNSIIREKVEIYNTLYVKVKSQMKDPELLRTILSGAVQDAQLPLPEVIDICTKYVDFEIECEEFARARSLYKHAASLGHPDSRILACIWDNWMKFEASQGTEHTYNEMLKYKRMVASEYEALSDYRSELNPMGFVKGEAKQTSPEVETSDPNAIDLDMDM